MISWLVVVVVEKQVSACWSDFCKLNFGKHYESLSVPALWRPIKSGGKIGINLWSVLLTHRGFSLLNRERETERESEKSEAQKRRKESVRITENPIHLHSEMHNPIN